MSSSPRPNPSAPSSLEKTNPKILPRRIDVQPAMDDPIIANKKTYWESNGQITRKVRIV
jgi:hypothetical protein